MDDLISRMAAIEYFMTNLAWHDEDGYEIDDADEKREIITDLVNGIPAVDAVPVVHGRWVNKNEEGVYGPTYCSVCDFELRIDDMPYCPKCGAKMDEVQKEAIL